MTEQDNRGNIVLKWLREEYQLGRKQAIAECIAILSECLKRVYIDDNGELQYVMDNEAVKRIEKLKSEGD